MDYVLVSDDCSDCSYVSKSLTLLKLSFKKIFLQDIDKPKINNVLNTIPDSSAIFFCKNLTKKYAKEIEDIFNSVNRNIISWGSSHAHESANNTLHLLNMPFSHDELKETLAKCVSHINTEDLNNPVFNKLVGKSKTISEIKSMIMHVAKSDTTVLIQGQSGVGKDIIALCIHQLSERKSNPFVPINCGAIPTELMESELFGHEKGAFTGALTRRLGRFEIANHGTLFLDEIGDMPLAMQVKLLRVLQERKIERVGGNASLDIDVRLIAATHKNLEEMITLNQFRDDLFYRLNVFPINVPSLQERKEDIPLIINHQLEKIYERIKHRVEFTDKTLDLLCNYAWPGNIRELQNFLERMVILYPDEVLGPDKINIKKRKQSKKKYCDLI